MLILRRAEERGSADFGWLQSKHSFSFGEYYDERFMGFSALRVINDDLVAPNMGFHTHGHRDMEIISYVLRGEIAHKDSEGNVETLPAGEFQLMSAGSGIRHSEFNPSAVNDLRFLQIWIQPNVTGQAPGYQQKNFGQDDGFTLIVSPDGRDDSLVIKQDACLYQVILPEETELEFEIDTERNYYLHLVAGEIEVNGQPLKAGDGLGISAEQELDIVVGEQLAKALFFDLP